MIKKQNFPLHPRYMGIKHRHGTYANLDSLLLHQAHIDFVACFFQRLFLRYIIDKNSMLLGNKHAGSLNMIRMNEKLLKQTKGLPLTFIHSFIHSLYLYTVTCSKNLFFHTSVVKTINIKTRLKDR